MESAPAERPPGPAAEPAALPEASLRAAFEALPEAALIVDRAGCVQCASALAYRLLGAELVIGQSAAWSEPDPERGDSEDAARTSSVARATGLSLRRTRVSLPDADGLSLIVLTAVFNRGGGVFSA
jgi:hypothetical protein